MGLTWGTKRKGILAAPALGDCGSSLPHFSFHHFAMGVWSPPKPWEPIELRKT